MRMTVMITKAVAVPAVTCLVAVACTSAIWIGAYYIGVKKDDTVNVVYPENPDTEPSPAAECTQPCEFHLVESIPANLTYPTPNPFNTTTSAWLRLISEAKSTIEIASYYWTLRPGDEAGYYDYTAQEGVNVFNALVDAASKRNVSLRITQNAQSNNETAELAQRGLAQVRSLNFTYFMGAGILHTKAWVVDGKHLYVGSANMDWRSLTQVKELGVAIYDCPCLAADMQKMLEVYWEMGAPNKKLPSSWPDSLATSYNFDTPLSVTLNNEQSAVYMSSAPPEFCPQGRMSDVDAILNVIGTATQFIHISVMDYVPAIIYGNNQYWPVIDDALRKAAYKFVSVKLLMSRWANTRSNLFPFLRSLADINDGLCIEKLNSTTGQYQCIQLGSVEVRLFEVPAYGNQSQIKYARVNHNKYMVTDNAAYIGTSNWSGDYFVSTGGIGFVVRADDIQQTSSIVRDVNEKIFQRDWNSQYSKSIDEFDNSGNPIVH